MNYTSNDAYRNNNNLIRLRSSKLAQNYTTEFEEMFDEDLFGPADRAATPYPSLTINGVPIEVYFSPDDGVAAHLIDTLATARQSICFLAFSFTSDDIGDALLARAEAGVTVAGVFETSQYKSNGKSSEFDRLRTAGLDVWLDANPRNLHHKVFVIDGQTVITGSYNFSANAENTNDENAMIIHSPEIAGLYQAQCQLLLSDAKK
jgi:phosphatidylserine/phosphatidylglycerophosphate/cardiolipin synthase-like enzyme